MNEYYKRIEAFNRLFNDNDWNGFTAHVALMNPNENDACLSTIIQRLRKIFDMFAEDEVTKQKELSTVMRCMHYLRDLKVVNTQHVSYRGIIDASWRNADVLLTALQNTVHDFNMNKNVDRDGLFLLSATVLNPWASKLVKPLIDLGCDIHQRNGDYGRAIHFVDVAYESAVENFKTLIAHGADPLEELEYEAYPDGHTASMHFKQRPRFKSFREYVEYNYDHESEPEDLPDGYDESVLDEICSILDRLQVDKDAKLAIGKELLTLGRVHRKTI